MNDREAEQAVAALLREHGLVLDAADRAALVELYPVFRRMAARLRIPATREVPPAAASGERGAPSRADP